MELDHTETIKRAVMAGLGVAFVSRYAVEDEVRSGRLRALPVQRMKIRRHFHVIHDERRPLSAARGHSQRFLRRTVRRRLRSHPEKRGDECADRAGKPSNPKPGSIPVAGDDRPKRK
jgi:DNA-binding transcriptional LysR family regulator